MELWVTKLNEIKNMKCTLRFVGLFIGNEWKEVCFGKIILKERKILVQKHECEEVLD